ncbi:hypothetical protein [Archangium lansingense]|uniref:Uncharacterized protein n=1 Tax=Archangium lansingense TaxID=2995310 RepID=A0ABT4A8V5_9BACT|nr:hypothetical protein [Archangium lansinium]MCY1078026.1 hypothetical protein [Archangium lansinium]
MNDEHKPESTYGDEWFALDDGLTRGRGRNVMSGPCATRHPSVTSTAPARKEEAQPVAVPAKLPEQSELLLEARRLFDSMGAHLPQRISTEELGDALEALQKMVKEGQPKWKIQARILSTLFWVSAHSVQDGVHAILGTETAATGNSGGKGQE